MCLSSSNSDVALFHSATVCLFFNIVTFWNNNNKTNNSSKLSYQNCYQASWFWHLASIRLCPTYHSVYNSLSSRHHSGFFLLYADSILYSRFIYFYIEPAEAVFVHLNSFHVRFRCWTLCNFATSRPASSSSSRSSFILCLIRWPNASNQSHHHFILKHTSTNGQPTVYFYLFQSCETINADYRYHSAVHCCNKKLWSDWQLEEWRSVIVSHLSIRWNLCPLVFSCVSEPIFDKDSIFC